MPSYWDNQKIFANQGNHQNEPPWLHYKCWLIFMGMKQKRFSKRPTQNKWDLQLPQFLTLSRILAKKYWKLAVLKNFFFESVILIFFAPSPWKVNIYNLLPISQNRNWKNWYYTKHCDFKNIFASFCTSLNLCNIKSAFWVQVDLPKCPLGSAGVTPWLYTTVFKK